MAIDTTNITKAIADLTNQVAATEGTEASATALINGFAAQVTSAVTTALAADNAADQGTVDSVTAAINSVTTRFTASAAALGNAVAANNPNPVPPAPPTPTA